MTRKMEEKGKLKSAHDIDYIKIIRAFCWGIGSWPEEAFGNTVPRWAMVIRWLLPFTVMLLMSGQINYMKVNFNVLPAYELMNLYISVALIVVMMAMTIFPCMQKYHTILKDFLLEFHLFNIKDNGKYYAKITKHIDKISYIFTIYYMSMSIITSASFNLMAFYANFNMGAFNIHNKPENITPVFTFYVAYPGIDVEAHLIMMTVLYLIIALAGGILICATDLLVTLIIFQIIGHLKILMFEIETISCHAIGVSPSTMSHKPSLDEMLNENAQHYDVNQNKVVFRKIVDIMRHHQRIASDRVSSFFGPLLVLSYTFQVLTGCVLLVMMSRADPGNLFRFGLVALVALCITAQISITFEMVHTLSKQLIVSVYCTPWELMDVGNRRVMRLLLQRVQTPLQVTAMGLVPVGVQTFGSILKTTLTYYLFLSEFSDN